MLGIIKENFRTEISRLDDRLLSIYYLLEAIFSHIQAGENFYVKARRQM